MASKNLQIVTWQLSAKLQLAIKNLTRENIGKEILSLHIIVNNLTIIHIVLT